MNKKKTQRLLFRWRPAQGLLVDVLSLYVDICRGSPLDFIWTKFYLDH